METHFRRFPIAANSDARFIRTLEQGYRLLPGTQPSIPISKRTSSIRQPRRNSLHCKNPAQAAVRSAEERDQIKSWAGVHLFLDNHVPFNTILSPVCMAAGIAGRNTSFVSRDSNRQRDPCIGRDPWGGY